MWHRHHFAFLAVATSIVLVVGCRTGPKRAPAADQPRKAGTRSTGTAHLASAHAHYAAGVVAELNGDPVTALAEFQRALAEDPGDETLLLDVTRRLLVNKQPEKALGLLLAATSHGDASGDVYARLGSVQGLLGHPDEAIQANRMAIEKSPQILIGYQNLFQCLLAAKQNEDALKVLESAAQQKEVDAGFLLGIADLYQNYAQQFPTQREVTKSATLRLLTRARDLKPAEPQLRLRLADGFFNLGEQKSASEIYLTLLGQIGDLPLVLENVRARLAEFFIRSDDRVRAREQLEAIAREDPSNVQVQYFLASLAYDDKRWADAATHLRRTILLNPNFAQGYYDLAAALLAAGDAPAAAATLEQARARFPQNFLGEYLSAITAVRQKYYAEGLKHFTAAEVIARATEPKRLTADFYFEVAIAYERATNRVEAAKYFEQALQLKPEFPEAQNYLGYMWAEQGENLERARELIEQALKAEPKSAAYLDSMGWVLFKLKQNQPALEYLLQAVAESEKPDATLYDHLGDIYAALGQEEKAREAWKKSVELEDNQNVRAKLKPPASP